MGLETGDYIADLNPSNPLPSDPVSQGDDHDRLTKKCVQQTFPSMDGPVTCTPADLNQLTGLNIRELQPTGMLGWYWGATAPDGWLVCDGAAIDVQYTELIALIGANTPDLRGYFIRGHSVNNLVDPDGPRAPGDGPQADSIEAHNHSYYSTWANVDPGVGGSKNQIASCDGNFPCGTQDHNEKYTTGDNPVGSETRPKNYAALIIIKT